jgi:hypothetical protein
MTTTKEARAALVAALRSGQYKQGRRKLRPTNDTFCCMGVACDRFAKLTGRGRWENGVRPASVFVVDDEARDMSLPLAVQEFYGFATNEAGYSGKYSAHNCLTGDNDSRRHTFEQIADTIEAEPTGLVGEPS